MLPCTPQDNFFECETKVSSKNIGMGYVKLHGFYDNP